MQRFVLVSLAAAVFAAAPAVVRAQGPSSAPAPLKIAFINSREILQRTPGWRVEAPPPELTPGLPLDGPYLRTLPGPEGWDGFFAARLRRAP